MYSHMRLMDINVLVAIGGRVATEGGAAAGG